MLNTNLNEIELFTGKRTSSVSGVNVGKLSGSTNPSLHAYRTLKSSGAIKPHPVVKDSDGKHPWWSWRSFYINKHTCYVRVEFIAIMRRKSVLIFWYSSHTCKLSIFYRDCPFFDPRKREKKKQFYQVSLISWKSACTVVMHRKLRKVHIFKDIPPYVPIS